MIANAKINRQDLKMFADADKVQVRQTIHQVARLDETGYDPNKTGHVPEGGSSEMIGGSISRKEYRLRTAQVMQAMSVQMQHSSSIQNPAAVQEENAAITLASYMEKNLFSGNNTLMPNVPDGFEAQVRKAPKNMQNIYDMRGASFLNQGEQSLLEISQMIRENSSGQADRMLYPFELSGDVQAFLRDKTRLNSNMSASLPSGQTANLAVTGIYSPNAENLQMLGKQAGLPLFKNNGDDRIGAF